jgi:DNA-binding response OmpR family regulator
MAEQKSILIVDDDSEILTLLKGFFEEKQFNVLEAANGTKALEVARTNPPDLMVTDLLLPGIHGIDLVKSMKAEYRIPIIVISGIYKGGELSDFLESDYVDAYFIKPINLKLLNDKINSLLNE